MNVVVVMTMLLAIVMTETVIVEKAGSRVICDGREARW